MWIKRSNDPKNNISLDSIGKETSLNLLAIDWFSTFADGDENIKRILFQIKDVFDPGIKVSVTAKV